MNEEAILGNYELFGCIKIADFMLWIKRMRNTLWSALISCYVMPVDFFYKRNHGPIPIVEDIERKISRQEYLKKWEQKKLEEIREDIEDEQYLFDGVKLTDAEYHEMSYKKKIYDLVKKRSEEDETQNEYWIPEAYDQEGHVNQEKRFAVSSQSYSHDSAGDKMNPFAEQEAWEEHQMDMCSRTRLTLLGTL